ncbi:MAG: hypothetical protein ACYTAF_11885 [Planctomycetota bacterium]
MPITCLTSEQVHSVFDVTDALGLHRNWVVVPLAASDEPVELIMPCGKVLIRPPGGDAFDPWLEGLRGRLRKLDMHRVPRAPEHDPPKAATPACAPPGTGARTYLDRFSS